MWSFVFEVKRNYFSITKLANFFQVEYAPHVTIKSDHTPIFEGDDVTFACKAHANPSEMTYR